MIKDCQSCSEYNNEPEIAWACALTTIPERRETYLPLTLASLEHGGFPRPHLFVDGEQDSEWWHEHYPDHNVTCRYPRIRTYGNWFLSLHELWIRNATADRFVIFQDDLACYKNLRQYLDAQPFPESGYWNLYTAELTGVRFERIGQTRRFYTGWKRSADRGIGALATVFNRDCVLKLLQSSHMTERPIIRDKRDKERWWKCVDGGIVETLKKEGISELVHNPSLVEHIGEISSVRDPLPRGRWRAKEKLFMTTSISGTACYRFRGEEFDAMDLLKEDRLAVHS